MSTIPIIPVRQVAAPMTRSMELIIKPTEVCNFKCTFCSSTQISQDHYMVLDLEKIFDFLRRFPKTNTIIVNGGDPLMVRPNYYWRLIDFLDENDLPSTLSFTSNLWAFYKNPQKWWPILKHERVGVTTSFNYGDTRRITEDRVFTEKDFWNVSDLMFQYVGYRPDFISVITEENEDTALANVYLARDMDVECKLNYAMASGDQGIPYQLSKIYALYLEVYKQGLMPWEYNTKQMVHRLRDGRTTCPQARNCDSYIRALNPGGDYYTCGSLADDGTHSIDYNQEVYEGMFFTPLQDDADMWCLKQECLTCPMFQICNGCRKTVKDMKEHNMVESHCKLMKTLAPEILELNNELHSID